MGAFVVFEGIDGSGKSIQASTLVNTLTQHGKATLLTQEPGGTLLGETLGHWLKADYKRSDLAELFLFAAARAEHVARVIKPTLDKGYTVVCDRFTGSTIAYQGYARGISLELIQQINRYSTHGLNPTLNILLDIPLELAQTRKKADKLDHFEKAGSSFHQKARDGYLSLANNNPHEWFVVDGTLSKKAISTAIWDRVQSHIDQMSQF